MTKAERIVHLYAKGLAVKEIAEIVGCLPAYVRVAARQRKGSSWSEIDRRYCTSDRGREVRLQARLRYQQKQREQGSGEASP